MPPVVVLFLGCAAGYGVVPASSQSKSSAWTSTYVKSFTCEACGPNSVAFQPESNLVAVWDGANWSLQCRGSSSSADSSSGSDTSTGGSGGSAVGLAPQVPPQGSSSGGTAVGMAPRLPPGGSSSGGSSGGGSSSGIEASPAPGKQKGKKGKAVGLSFQQSSTAAAPGVPAATAAPTGAIPVAVTAAAVTSVAVGGLVQAPPAPGASTLAAVLKARRFYTAGSRQRRNAYAAVDSAPWWPGECIDCALAGATASPDRTHCGECCCVAPAAWGVFAVVMQPMKVHLTSTS
jgi:hypothetical protein